MNVEKMKRSLLILLGAFILTSCVGEWGAYQSSFISASSFVSGLNSVDSSSFSSGRSYVVLYTDETDRSTYSDQDDWFVIYDGKYGEYKAVSLQYIRSIVYYDYYSNNYSLAEEFRAIESYGGDYYGDDYEVVDSYGSYYRGRRSGYYYEDERESRDVNLLAAEAQEKKLYHKVANISYAYEVSLESAFSLASLGNKLEGMLKKGAAQEELTAEDQKVLMKDFEHFTGVTLEDVMAAGVDSQKKEEVLKKISAKLGTSTQNLEEKILPELLGVR